MSEARKAIKFTVKHACRSIGSGLMTVKIPCNVIMLVCSGAANKTRITPNDVSLGLNPIVDVLNITSSIDILSEETDVDTHFDENDNIVTKKDASDKMIAVGSLLSGIAHLGAIGLCVTKKKLKKTDIALIYGTDILSNSFCLIRNLKEKHREDTVLEYYRDEKPCENE